MIRYAKLGYVALNVSDLEKSCDFYGRLLGLERVESKRSEHCFLPCQP